MKQSVLSLCAAILLMSCGTTDTVDITLTAPDEQDAGMVDAEPTAEAGNQEP